MSKKVPCLALGSLLFALCFSVEAQQRKKVPRIGVLSGASSFTDPSPFDEFRQGLRELGYIERENILIEYRYAAGKFGRLPGLAAELVRLKVDVIFACCPGGPPSLATKNATTTIPVVFVRLGDPVGPGVVASLARPGGNVTGISGFAPELSGKQLELLQEAVPKITRVAVLLNLAVHRVVLREFEPTAKALGVQLQVLEARTPNDFDKAFSAMTKERPDALTVWADPMFFTHRKHIAEFAAKSRLPSVFVWKEYVEAGGLMSYGVDVSDLFRRAAMYVDKILKGAKPGDLPVEQPTKFELVINLKTARRIGVTIPPEVLMRADRVIR